MSSPSHFSIPSYPPSPHPSPSPLPLSPASPHSKGVTFGFECPEGQHLYKNCSICFFPSPASHTLPFQEASSYCASGGGALLSLSTSGDLYRVQRYLEGLQQERREFWIGYRHSETEERIAEGGAPAPSVVLNSTNFIPGRTQPGAGRCIGVKGGKFFTRACTRELRFMCEYFYTGEQKMQIYVV